MCGIAAVGDGADAAGHVDDAWVAGPAEQGSQALGQEGGAEGVGLEVLEELVGEGGSGGEDAGVVDEDVEVGELR